MSGASVARGTVIYASRRSCDVRSSGETLRVSQPPTTDAHGEHAQLVVGDDIDFDPIRRIVLARNPRRTSLERVAPMGGRARSAALKKKVIAANMDAVAIVTSAADPPFSPGAVDRFALAALAGGMQVLLVVNKIDLVQGVLPDAARSFESLWPVTAISVHRAEGLTHLRELLSGRRTVLAGHSGVGKSSLLNALEPSLDLPTREVRERTRTGRHVTTRATWLHLDDRTVLVDTPGVREIATGPVDRSLLRAVYPEIAEHALACRFRDCTHTHEPDCAVAAACERGEVELARLSSFRRLLVDVLG